MLREKKLSLLEKLSGAIKDLAIVGAFAIPVVLTGYQVVSDRNWRASQHKDLMSQGPQSTKRQRFYREYFFDDDGDGSIDRIEKMGSYCVGLRGGIPLRYRQTIRLD